MLISFPVIGSALGASIGLSLAVARPSHSAPHSPYWTYLSQPPRGGKILRCSFWGRGRHTHLKSGWPFQPVYLQRMRRGVQCGPERL